MPDDKGASDCSMGNVFEFWYTGVLGASDTWDLSCECQEPLPEMEVGEMKRCPACHVRAYRRVEAPDA